jgi:hypothetical protein
VLRNQETTLFSATDAANVGTLRRVVVCNLLARCSRSAASDYDGTPCHQGTRLSRVPHQALP